MSKRICVYPGSFDPITVGHMDLITRAASMFDEVIVAVLQNRSKRGAIATEERLRLIDICCAALPNVHSEAFGGLLVDYIKTKDNAVVLRGVRNSSDFDAEMQLAGFNVKLAPGTETIFLPARPEHVFISSSAVRELASFDGDITGFVPACVQDEIKELLRLSRNA